MSEYILALDQGTTSSRAIIFNKSGNIIGQDQILFPQIYPRPGWVEHDPQKIWETQYSAARNAIKEANISDDQINSIGITNQRETTILWDRYTGKPVYNAIVWQCRRSTSICQNLISYGLSRMVHEKTGLLLDPYFSGTKLIWLFNEFPELKTRAKNGELLFGTVDSWLIWNLTGNHLTDSSNASRTLLFNICDNDWDDDILKEFDIPKQILPDVLPSSANYGLTKKGLFTSQLTVSGCAGDQQAALFGHACFQSGDVKNTYGTGCFALMNTGDKIINSNNNLLTTIAWNLENKITYAIEGAVFIAGAIIQWLRDELGIISNSSETETIARTVMDTGNVYIVPAFTGLGAPYWDPEARGSILGLTRGTNKAHITRAALESIAFQVSDLLHCMENDHGKSLRFIKADGGASANGFLMQFQSDILDKPVILSETNEITALGAAYFAGLFTGYWKNFNEIEENWKIKHQYIPNMETGKRISLLTRWQKAVMVTQNFKC